MNQGARAVVLEVVGRDRRSVEEGAVALFADQQAFFEKTVECGHHCCVCEGGAQAQGYLLDGRAPLRPKDGEDLAFALPEANCGGRGPDVGAPDMRLLMQRIDAFRIVGSRHDDNRRVYGPTDPLVSRQSTRIYEGGVNTPCRAGKKKRSLARNLQVEGGLL